MRLNMARGLIGVVIFFNLRAGSFISHVEYALCGGAVESHSPPHIPIRGVGDANDRSGE